MTGVGRFTYTEWLPSMGRIGHSLAIDTETEEFDVDDTTAIPRLVVLTATNESRKTYLIHPCHARDFLNQHRDIPFVLHNVAFDRVVLLEATGVDLADWAACNRIIDTGLLYQLVRLAEIGLVPGKWGLDVLVQRYLHYTLPKDESVRCTFGVYIREFGVVPLNEFRGEHRVYAAMDPLATRLLCEKLLDAARAVALHHNVDVKLLLSLHIQVKAALALDQVGRNGMCIDLSKVGELRHLIEEGIAASDSVLRKYGYASGDGETARYTKVMTAIERDMGLRFPRTKTGRITKKAEHLESYCQHEFIDAFLRHSESTKLLSTFIEKLDNSTNSVHPSFTTLVRTGRTSCRRPNLQQLPRGGKIREAFIASPDHLLLTADYKALELCALAQVCYERYGRSQLRELINAGTDPHCWLASQITGKSQDLITSEERQTSKAAAFGFPGGLGASSFASYARKDYGIEISEAEAERLRQRWFQAFPEMEEYMDDEAELAPELNQMLQANPKNWSADIMLGVMLRIAGGNPTKRSNGDPYSEEIVDHVWNCLSVSEFPDKEAHLPAIVARTGNDELRAAVSPQETVIWPSGRIRSRCWYCEARNSWFQGRASDGSKLALWRLFREGFRIANFIHDEVIVESPINGDHLVLARQVEAIMVTEMQQVIPDVRIAVEYALMPRWYKEAIAVYDDPQQPTRLLPWTPPV